MSPTLVKRCSVPARSSAAMVVESGKLAHGPETSIDWSNPLEIGDYLRVLRRLWWMVVITIAVGAGIGYATSLRSTPEYESTAQLFVTTQSGSSVGDAYQNNLFSQQRAISYAGLATSQQVAARAVDQLKAPLSADELRSKVSAQAVENTVLLDITARDSDPAAAQTYANAVAVQLVQLVSELETSRRGGTPAAGAVIVDDASYPTQAAGLSLLSRIGLGAAGGLVAGLVLVIVLAFSDTRLRRADRVDEEAGGLVLGTLVDDSEKPERGQLDLAAGGPAVERLRALRNNVVSATTPAGNPVRTFAITSQSASEYRSTVAKELATVLSEGGHTVLLVDGDFVNAGLSAGDQATGTETSRGLGAVLAGHSSMADSILRDAVSPGCSLLPAGNASSRSRQLWSSKAARESFDEMRQRFDYVVVDTPPLKSCADGAAVARLLDGALLVVKLNSTRSADLKKAVTALSSAHAFLVGIVVAGERGHRRALARMRKANASVQQPVTSSDRTRSSRRAERTGTSQRTERAVSRPTQAPTDRAGQFDDAQPTRTGRAETGRRASRSTPGD